MVSRLIRSETALPRLNIDLSAIAIVILGIVLALFIGLIASSGNVVYGAVVAGVLGGSLLLARPWWMVSALVGIVFVAHGAVQFFTGFGQLQWIASMLGMALMLIWGFMAMGQRQPEMASGLTPVIAAGFVFMSIMTLSSFANGIPFMQGVVGFRAYVPFWGAFLFLSTQTRDLLTWRRVFVGLVIVALIQWPVELYQKLFVVSARSAAGYFGSAFDSIVGTFGGAMFGGGESGSLAVFLAVFIVIATALRKERHIPRWLYLLLALSILVSVGLCETKIVFFLVPVGFGWIYRAYVVRHPGKFLLGAAIAGILLAGLVTVYYKLHYEETARNVDPIALVQQRFLYAFDPSAMPAANWPGRVTGLVIWYHHHDSLSDSFRTLFGHGAGSSLSSSSLIVSGDASKRYGVGLDVTGATKLLWESGLFGLLAFLSISLVGFIQSGRLASSEAVPAQHRAGLKGVQAALPLIGVAIFYEATAVSSPPMQLTFLLLLAYVDFWYRRVKGATG